MRLQCAKHDLTAGVQTVQRAVASKIAIPALGGILMTADDETNTLTLRATDLELTISCEITATVEEAGSVVIPGRFMAEICRNLNASSVSLSTNGSNVVLTCGKSKYNLRSLPAEEFPERASIEGTPVHVDQNALLKGIKKVSRAAAKDESRPTISGVLLVVDQGKLEVVATDSYRLALYSSKIDSNAPSGASSEMNLILPTRSLEEVLRIFGPQENGEFSLLAGDGEVSFVADKIQLTTRTIEGNFPQYRQIIPQEFEMKITIDKEELAGAVRRAAVVASTSPLKFHWQPGGLEVTAGTQEVGESQELVEIDFDHDPFEIAFNALFLQDGLQMIEGDSVEFRFNSSVKPGLMVSPTDEGYVYLIMPVRLN